MCSANKITLKRIARFGQVFINIHYRKDFMNSLKFNFEIVDLGEGVLPKGTRRNEKENYDKLTHKLKT